MSERQARCARMRDALATTHSLPMVGGVTQLSVSRALGCLEVRQECSARRDDNERHPHARKAPGLHHEQGHTQKEPRNLSAARHGSAGALVYMYSCICVYMYVYM